MELRNDNELPMAFYGSPRKCYTNSKAMDVKEKMYEMWLNIFGSQENE